MVAQQHISRENATVAVPPLAPEAAAPVLRCCGCCCCSCRHCCRRCWPQASWATSACRRWQQQLRWTKNTAAAAEPSRAEPSRAEPSQAKPTTTAPSPLVVFGPGSSVAQRFGMTPYVEINTDFREQLARRCGVFVLRTTGHCLTTSTGHYKTNLQFVLVFQRRVGTRFYRKLA